MAHYRYGTSLADWFDLSMDDLWLSTDGGDDTIIFGGWNGVIDAGAGDDAVTVTWGSAQIFAGPGADWLRMSGASGILDASGGTPESGGLGSLPSAPAGVVIDGSGVGGAILATALTPAALHAAGWAFDDILDAVDSQAILRASEGDDIVRAAQGSYLVEAGDGDDLVMVAYAGADVRAGAGADRIVISDANVSLDAGEGDDAVSIAYASGALSLGEGRNTLAAAHGAYSIGCGAGDDVLSVRDSEGVIDVGAGDDMVTTQLSNVTVRGGEGSDLLVSLSAATMLDGGAGDDRLVAVTGAATLKGGTGADLMIGGADNQMFLYDALDGSLDEIRQFVRGEDHLAFTAGLLGLVEGSTFQAQMFALGAANDARAQFVFDAARSILSFDADGTGAGAAKAVAKMVGLTTMSAGDIWIV